MSFSVGALESLEHLPQGCLLPRHFSRTGSVAQVVDRLPSKYKALSPILSTTGKKNLVNIFP
jgi:hypothetical protein